MLKQNGFANSVTAPTTVDLESRLLQNCPHKSGGQRSAATWPLWTTRPMLSKCDHVIFWEESKRYILWKSLHTENDKANYGCSQNVSLGIKNILKKSNKASKTKVKVGTHFILGIKTRWKAPMRTSKPIKVEVTNIQKPTRSKRHLQWSFLGDKSDDDRTVKNKENKQTDSLTVMTT